MEMDLCRHSAKAGKMGREIDKNPAEDEAEINHSPFDGPNECFGGDGIRGE